MISVTVFGSVSEPQFVTLHHPFQGCYPMHYLNTRERKTSRPNKKTTRQRSLSGVRIAAHTRTILYNESFVCGLSWVAILHLAEQVFHCFEQCQFSILRSENLIFIGVRRMLNIEYFLTCSSNFLQSFPSHLLPIIIVSHSNTLRHMSKHPENSLNTFYFTCGNKTNWPSSSFLVKVCKVICVLLT